MNIALLLVVNCKFDIIINRTQCNKCLRVNSFIGALTNMVCELKITSWSKKNCVKISW